MYFSSYRLSRPQPLQSMEDCCAQVQLEAAGKLQPASQSKLWLTVSPPNPRHDKLHAAAEVETSTA